MNHERILHVSLQQVAASSSSIHLPWENNSLTALTLGTLQPHAWLSMPTVPGPFPVVQGPKRKDQLAYFGPVVSKRKRTQGVALDKEPDDRRSVVLSKWLSVIKANLHESQIGLQFLKLHDSPNAAEEIFCILRDVAASKSTATLEVRVNSLLMYWKWFRKFAPSDLMAFPVQGEFLYQYFRELDNVKNAAARAASMLQAVNFSAHVFGLKDMGCTSLRCVGSAHRQFLRKRMLKSKDVLTMNMCYCLEVAAKCILDPGLRAAAGACCICLHGRLRSSDVNRLAFADAEVVVVEGKVVKGFIESATVKSKTSKSKEKQTAFSPVVIPAIGVSGLYWWPAFLRARHELGMDEIPCFDDQQDGNWHEQACVMPSLCQLARGVVTPMDSNELSILLRWILGQFGFTDDELKNIASHSLKATWLTAAGKFNVPVEMRQLLGYHVLRRESSVLNYNRDNMAGPIDCLWDLVKRVRRGLFVPDAQRALRRVKKELAVHLDVCVCSHLSCDSDGLVEVCRRMSFNEAVAAKFTAQVILGKQTAQTLSTETELQTDELNTAEDLVLVADDTSALSSDEEDALSLNSETSQLPDDLEVCFPLDEELLLTLAAEVGGDVEQFNAEATSRIKCIPKCACLDMVYRHVSRKTVHFGHVSQADVLACGRRLTVHQCVAQGDHADLWPKCKDCFGL